MTYLAPLMTRRSHRVRRSLCEAMVIIAMGSLAGGINNLCSSRSIPLIGDWGKAYGVPSPGGKHAATHGNIEIDLAEASRLFENGATFLDARPRQGYLEGHIPGARSVPADEFRSAPELIAELREPGATAVIYCQGMECDEAHLLASRLREAGIESVCVFAGGFQEWKSHGSPLERGGGRL